MVLRYVMLCLLVLAAHVSRSQSLALSGKVLSEDNKVPVAYANVGILNTPVGTITNADGTFEITIPDSYSSEELLIAALGYQRKSLPVKSLQKEGELIIYLHEELTVLEDLTIKSRKPGPFVTSELGNPSYNEGSLYADSAAAGAAMALLIENKSRGTELKLPLPYHLVSARLRIAHNTFDKFMIRMRILAVDANGKPGEDLVKENIIVSSGMRKGWLKFNLEDYNIRVNVPSFFVAFEWLIEDEDRQLLLEQYKEYRRQFPKRVTADTLEVAGQKVVYNNWRGFRAGTSFGSSSTRYSRENFSCFYRNNSHGKWKRSSFIVAARITVKNYE
jgi:hypothetical protein